MADLTALGRDASPSRHNLLSWAALLVIGLAWGSTQLFSKLIVNDGHHPVGISFTGTVLGLAILIVILAARGQRLPLSRGHLVFYGVCGLTGTALPHVLGFTAMQELQVGVMSILIALVPIMTYLGALLMRMDKVSPLRMLGLVFGTGSVMLLVLPEASLPRPGQAVWVVLPVLISLCYTVENIYIGRAQPRDIDPMQTMCGLFLAATVLQVPAVAVTGQIMLPGDFDLAEISLVVMTCFHIGAYAGFVWLISRAGPVFAAQVAYIVTLAGVVLGIAVLGEENSGWVWLSLLLMMLGLALVQPRDRQAEAIEGRA